MNYIKHCRYLILIITTKMSQYPPVVLHQRSSTPEEVSRPRKRQVSSNAGHRVWTKIRAKFSRTKAAPITIRSSTTFLVVSPVNLETWI